MLRLEGINKDYMIGETVTRALIDITMEFPNHQFVAVLGQSGCGKTTLLNIIGGLDQYTRGDLFIQDSRPRNSRTATGIPSEFHDRLSFRVII